MTANRVVSAKCCKRCWYLDQIGTMQRKQVMYVCGWPDHRTLWTVIQATVNQFEH